MTTQGSPDSRTPLRASGTTAPAPAARPGKAVSIVAWVLQVGLALSIAPGGLLKLIGDPAMVDLFADIGAGQWLRYLVGICEIAGGIGLLVPKVRALAAVGLFLLLLGASFINLFVIDETILMSGILAVVALVIAYLRRSELPVRSS
jgi:putative oxidoreductase